MSSLGNKEIMAKNIRHYMSAFNVTQTEICNTLGIKMPTFSDWVNAKTYPRIDKIELIPSLGKAEPSVPGVGDLVGHGIAHHEEAVLHNGKIIIPLRDIVARGREIRIRLLKNNARSGLDLCLIPLPVIQVVIHQILKITGLGLVAVVIDIGQVVGNNIHTGLLPDSSLRRRVKRRIHNLCLLFQSDSSSVRFPTVHPYEINSQSLNDVPVN